MEVLVWVVVVCVGGSGGLFLPLEVMDPAKNLFYYWAHWDNLEWEVGGVREKEMGATCDVTPRATLAYAYFKTLGVDGNISPGEDKKAEYKVIREVATHLKFFKKRLLPLPERPHEHYCAYDPSGTRLVCDYQQSKCVSCDVVTKTNEDLYEACNLSEGEADPPQTEEGIVLYESVKRWLNEIAGKWAIGRGNACTASDKQTLSLARMRRAFASFPYRRRKDDAEDKNEWAEEAGVVELYFTGDSFAKTKTWLGGFGDSDASSVVYCSPVEGDQRDHSPLGADEDRLVCGDGKTCVWCKDNQRTGWRFPSGPLREACEELGVEIN